MDNGWLKIYRVLLDKTIWKSSTPEQKTVLITLLLMANHEPHEWEWSGVKFQVERGQFITSLNSIVEKSGKGISIQNVRSSLKRFQKLHFLTVKPTKTGTLVTITNWDEYQPKEDTPTKKATKTQQRGNKEVTTNKNDKNDKNEITNIPLPPKMTNQEIKEREILDIKEKFNLTLNFAGLTWEFIQYRKLIKKPYKTDAGIKLFLSDIKKLAGTDFELAKELVDYAKGREWLTVYAKKDNNNLNNNQNGITKNKQESNFSDHYKGGVFTDFLSKSGS